MNTLFGIATSEFTFTSRSDLFEGILDECGDPMTNSDHQVIATTPHGARFARSVGVSAWQVHHDDEGFPSLYRTNDPAELDAVAATLAEKLEEIDNPRLDSDVWYEIEPVYGSPAFQGEAA